jgi:hypothetical protein
MAQVLIALHHLSENSGLERDRIHLNVSQGPTHDYTWKLIDLLVSVANRYIKLPPLVSDLSVPLFHLMAASSFLMEQTDSQSTTENLEVVPFPFDFQILELLYKKPSMNQSWFPLWQ